MVARLCNSNPVKDALPPLLTDIQRALGIEPKDVKQGKKRLRAKDIEKQKEQEKTLPRQPLEQAESEDQSMAEDDDESDIPRSKAPTKAAGDGSDDEFAQYADRLAGSDSEEDEDGHSDEEALHPKAKASRIAALRAALADVSPSESVSPSPSPSPSLSPEPESARIQSTKPGTSAFVPSLSMGGYWSGSESEAENFEDEKPKKNRRGQRARQAIAEKKFGKNAKHLQNQAKTGKNDRNAGWDAKRGATDGPRGARGGPRPRFDRPGQARDNAPEPPKKKHRDDQGALHPSWEAAKKAKEAKKVTANFEGKKITFD